MGHRLTRAKQPGGGLPGVFGTVRSGDQQGCRPSGGLLTPDGHGVVPLTSIAPGFDSVQAFIEANAVSPLSGIEAQLAQSAQIIDLHAVTLLSPLLRPIQIRDVLCFLDHMRNSGRLATQMQGGNPDDYVLPPVFESAPRYYKANRMCVIGTGQDVLWPEGCSMLDYELELGIVVGKQGKNISRDRARDYIFGYTIFNDVSARDIQLPEMVSGLGPAKGKDFDTGNVLGPCIVTADEVDPDDMTMVARLNGEEVSRGNSSQMDHKVEDILVHVSRNETIYPGEVLGSGTVPLGCLLEHGRSLSPGDEVELEISGIGMLRNRFVQPAGA